MRNAFAMLALLLLGAAPALAQVPPSVQQGARQAQAECRSAGGRPNLLPAFQTPHDFNGDGQPDYVHDYSALDCQGAASFFCGSAGCPIVVFLSPGHRAQPLGHAQGWTVERAGPLPVMVLTLHGSSCGRVGADSCEQRVGWNGRDMAALGPGARPAAPAMPQTAPPVATPALPPTAVAPGGIKGTEPGAAAAPAGAWEVRTGADGRAIAVAAGPGVVRAVTLLCHEGVPVVAVALRARPPAGPVTFGLAGRGGRAQVPVTPGGGPGDGMIWYGDLRNSALPRLFTGNDSAVEVLVNGGMQGRLSLHGSTRAVREALAPCLRV